VFRHSNGVSTKLNLVSWMSWKNGSKTWNSSIDKRKSSSNKRKSSPKRNFIIAFPVE
jgi:hypothetical protein